MTIVPALILWSAAWLPSPGAVDPRTAGPGFEAASPPPLGATLAPSSDAPGLADFGAMRAADEGDPFDGDVNETRPAPRRADPRPDEAPTPLPNPVDRPHAHGRSLPIRC